MKKENQRVRLTKTLLKNSLLKLSKKKPFNQITITELCDEAQINRCTFYTHYASPYDVLTEMEDELISELKKQLITKRSSVYSLSNHIEILSDYFRDNKDISKLVFANNSSNSDFAERLFKMIFSVYPAMSEGLNKFSGESRQLVTTFYVNGIYNVIRQWLLEDFSISSHDIGLLGEKITKMML